jgi:hypothetical protein
MGVDGSRARLAYSGTTYEESGTLAQIQFQSLNSNLYGVSGIGRDTGGIDQYSQGPAYAWELAPQTNRVIVRVDEPGTANTSFNDQYTFLINESDFNLRGTPGPLFWTRVERVDGRIRARLWQDGTAEPSTWDYDGQDEIVDGPYGPVLGLSHNDGTSGGPESMDIRSFEFYEITEPDTTAPTVAVATPTNGATVSGANVALEATATDNESVAGVTFYVDNTLVGSEVTATSGPDTFTISFDSTSLADGDYAVYAVARDVAGNYATSSSVTVDVDNEPEEVEETESRGSSASATRVGERRSVSKSSENPGDTSETTVASSAPIEVSFPVRTTDRVHVRSVPGGTSLGLQPAGAVGAYGSQAPAIADSYIWNYVDFTNGPDGWVAKPFTEYAQEGEGLSTPAQRIELSLHLIALLQLILELQTELDALQAAEA